MRSTPSSSSSCHAQLEQLQVGIVELVREEVLVVLI